MEFKGRQIKKDIKMIIYQEESKYECERMEIYYNSGEREIIYCSEKEYENFYKRYKKNS